MRYGQRKSPGLSEVLEAAIQAAVEGFFVSMPGIVQKYDAAAQTADVLPALKRVVIAEDGTEIKESLPIVTKAPVLFPRAGGFFLSLPLAKGDPVLLVFCDRSIEDYMLSSGKETEPGCLRTHDISDAVVIPGFYPLTKPIKSVVSSGAAFGKETGAQVRVKDASVEVTSNGLPSSVGGFVALATLVLAELNKIKTAFDAHTHVYNPGPGAPVPTAIPVPLLPAPTSPASSNLKAD